MNDKVVELALKKYSKQLVSIGKAAELARVPLTDFIKVAAERKILLNYSVNSLKEDFKAAVKAKRVTSLRCPVPSQCSFSSSLRL